MVEQVASLVTVGRTPLLSTCMSRSERSGICQTGQEFRLDAVIRLDDDPRIAIQAGRHKLTNPDFVLFGRTPDRIPILQASDSKFSVDTIKPAQVSAEALQALLDVEHGLVRVALEQDLHDHDVAEARVERGIFLSPVGPLTDYFLPRVLTDPRSAVERSHIELIDVGPSELFGELSEASLIGPLAIVDKLPASPRDHLLSAMYYLRVACACTWMWVEERTPLFTLERTADHRVGRSQDRRRSSLCRRVLRVRGRRKLVRGGRGGRTKPEVNQRHDLVARSRERDSRHGQFGRAR